MSSFGDNLRRERQMRGVTLEEISAATKISVRILQAMENEEFSKMPGGIFTRSFIRAYAKYLGLDEERVLAEYELAAEPRAELDLRRLVANNPAPRHARSRAPFVVLLVAVVLLFGGYALFRYSRRTAELQGNAPAASAPAPTPKPPPSEPLAPAIQASNTAVPTSTSDTAPGSQSLASGTDLVLQVAATELAWVTIDVDGRTTLRRELSPNEVQTFRARESFDVTTGNAQGITLTLNGEALRPLGRHGEVKSIHLTQDDLRNPAP